MGVKNARKFVSNNIVTIAIPLFSPKAIGWETGGLVSEEQREIYERKFGSTLTVSCDDHKFPDGWDNQ